MKHLLKRKGKYYYSRKVPKFISKHDTREYVRVSLKTDSLDIAIQKSVLLNQETEKYWSDLIKYNKAHSNDEFNKTVNLSRLMGFRFLSASEIARERTEDVIQRVQKAQYHEDNKNTVEAILGGVKQPELRLSEALKRFWDYSKAQTLNKDANKIRKWKNPRKKAVNNFIRENGDLPLTQITNLHIVKLRDYWITRMEEENIKADTVNKDFTHLKGVIDTVSTHENLEIDIDKLFRKIHLKEGEAKSRPPFESDFIRNELLKPDNLKQLNEEAKHILFAMVNTGARPVELVNLQAEDIVLDHEIPYIHIQPRKGYALKNEQSKRKIPLLGCSLKAFQKYPEGFDHYRANSDLLSKTINDFLLEKGLRPTLDHTLYSLRHSFQDRLTALELPDRIQCQLMGHKFKRPKYGEGASLEHLKKILEKVSFDLN